MNSHTFASGMFFHVEDREGFAVHQWNRDGFDSYIAFCAEALRHRERFPHLIASKPGGARRIFASLQDHAADSAARPIGMDEKSANLCRIAKRVQQRILASRPMIAPVEIRACAPAAASDNNPFGWGVLCSRALDSGRLGLRYDIRPVGDELAIDAKNGFERALDLCRRVVLRLQSADGRFDQFAQNGNIFRDSKAEVDVRLHRRSNAGASEWILSPASGGARQNSNCRASWAGMLGDSRAASSTKGDRGSLMLYMGIERFKNRGAEAG